MPSVNIYTKEQIDALISGSGGKTVTSITNFSELKTALFNANIGDVLTFTSLGPTSTNYVSFGCFTVAKKDSTAVVLYGSAGTYRDGSNNYGYIPYLARIDIINSSRDIFDIQGTKVINPYSGGSITSIENSTTSPFFSNVNMITYS